MRANFSHRRRLYGAPGTVPSRDSYEEDCGLDSFSILLLIADTDLRSRLCAQIARGLRCAIYVASELEGGFRLLASERPSVLLTSAEFAEVHGTPITEAVESVSPGTRVLFIRPADREAAAAPG